MKILFSNIGYAKGIDGSLQAHMRLFHRHIYSGHTVQRGVLSQLKALIKDQEPDICCFVEVDSGSVHSGRLNQLQELVDEDYPHFDIAGKYGENNRLSQMPLHMGKSNGFIAKKSYDFRRLYFDSGSKRLVYHLKAAEDLHIFFAHFSLSRQTRIRQFAELQVLLQSVEGNVIILADFNIFQGFSELKPLLDNTNLAILNDETAPTFYFHKAKHVLDLCLCSTPLAQGATLSVIPQPYSDHAALLLEIKQ